MCVQGSLNTTLVSTECTLVQRLKVTCTGGPRARDAKTCLSSLEQGNWHQWRSHDRFRSSMRFFRDETPHSYFNPAIHYPGSILHCACSPFLHNRRLTPALIPRLEDTEAEPSYWCMICIQPLSSAWRTQPKFDAFPSILIDGTGHLMVDR